MKSPLFLPQGAIPQDWERVLSPASSIRPYLQRVHTSSHATGILEHGAENEIQFRLRPGSQLRTENWQVCVIYHVLNDGWDDL